MNYYILLTLWAAADGSTNNVPLTPFHGQVGPFYRPKIPYDVHCYDV